MKAYLIVLVFSLTLPLFAQDMDTVLNEPVNLKVIDRPLSQAIRSIVQGQDLVVKDPHDLLSQTPVRYEKMNVSLQDALDDLLAPCQCTFVPVLPDTLVITKSKASSDISGRITNLETGEPVEFANVFVANTSLGCATDKDGNYEIVSIPRSIVQLEIRCVGYEQKSLRYNLKSGKSVRLDVKLQPRIYEMDEICAVANRERIIQQPGISSFSIRARQIDRMPGYGQKDLFRTLQMMPGVVSTNDYKSQLYIRGGNADQNLVLFDGATIYNPFHFSGILSAFDVDALQGVDLYAGGFGAEYGGRLSSVLDIRSRTGKSGTSAQFNISPLAAKMLLETPLGSRVNTLFSARRSYVSSMAKTLGNTVLPDFYDGIGSIKVRPFSADTLSLSGFYGNDRVVLQKAKETEQMSTQNIAGALNYNRWFGRHHILLHSSVGYFETLIPDYLERRQKNKNTLRENTHKIEYEGPLASFYRLEMGALYRNQQIYYKSSDPILDEVVFDERIEETAFYATHVLSVNQWTLEPGLRLARYHHAQDWQQEWRFAVQFKPYNFLTLRTAAGQYHQYLVTIYNENDTYNPVDIWLPPGDDLELASATHIIAGVQYVTPDLVGSLEFYVKQYNHLTQYNRERLFRQDPYFVQGKGRAMGLELTLQYLQESWQVWATYSLAKAEKELPFSFPEPGIDRFSPRYDRRHALNLSADYRPHDGIELSARFALGTGTPFAFTLGKYQRWSGFVLHIPGSWIRPGPGESAWDWMAISSERDAFRFPTYHRLDVSVKVTQKKWGMTFKPYAEILNLYNQDNVLYYDIQAEPQYSLPFMPLVGMDIVL